MKGIDSGVTTSFLLDRYKAERGMSCDGIEEKARKRLVDGYEESTIGKTCHLIGTSKVEAIPVGGCQGLRVMLRARDSAGKETDGLVYAVSDGKVMYDFFLRNQKEFFEKNLPVFEKSMATLRIAAGR